MAFLLLVLLFAGGSGQSLPSFVGLALREVTAVLRDAETQWMVFLCLAIYFVAFLFLRLSKAGAHGVTRPTIWLASALLISSVLYALDYSPSTQALTLLGGAVLGQGARLLKSRKSKVENRNSEVGGQKSEAGSQRSESGNGVVMFVVVVFVLLFTLASVWHPETGHTFEYRSHLRWSGPWDNPNTFGLLMGVGVLLAVAAGILACRRSGLPARWIKSPLLPAAGNVLNQRTFIPGGRMPSSTAARMAAATGWLGAAILCLVAAGFMARGLLHSYSRGAWVATGCGLSYLIGSGIWRLGSGFSKTESGRDHLTPALVLLPHPASGHPLPSDGRGKGGEGESRSCRSCRSWLAKSWLLISVILISVFVLSFWHLRQTEWHPARRALSAVNPVDFSWRNRVAAWEGALQIMAELPWFGAGWNHPERLYENYYLASRLQESAAIQMNDYLMLGATLGIPAGRANLFL